MAGFLWSLLYISISVSALLMALRLLRAPLLYRYRARTLYLITLGLLLLFLFPMRPSLLPRAVWEAAPVPVLSMTTEAVTQTSTPLPDTVEAPQTMANAPALAGQTADTTAKHTLIHWERWIGALWLAGMLSMLAVRVARHMRFLRLLRRWRTPLSPAYQTELEAQCARLGMRVPPAASTALVRTPTVVGLLHPQLLQPEGAAEPEQLPLILRHELCHLRRGDLWGKAVIDLICAVHWFNPLMLLFRRDAALLCEMACDEAVLHREDAAGRGAYLSAVVASLCPPDRLTTSLSTQFGGGMRRMKQRLALLSNTASRRHGVGLAAVVLVLALCTGGVLASAIAPVATIGPRMPMSGEEEYDSLRMPQEDYDFVMGFQSIIRDDLSLDESHALLQPHATRLREIFWTYSIENWFMEHLQYDLEEMTNLRATRSNYGFIASAIERNPLDFDRFIHQKYSILWQINDPSKTTVGERNHVVDALRARIQAYLIGIPWLVGEREQELRLAFQSEMEKEFSSDALDVILVLGTPWASGPIKWQKSWNETNHNRLMALYQPKYAEQTITAFHAALTPHLEELWQIHAQGMYVPHSFVRAVQYSMYEMEGNTEYPWTEYPYWYSVAPELSFALRWEVLAPDRLTVAERDAALNKAIADMRIAALGLDYTVLPVTEMTARIGPLAQDIAQTLSTDALRIEIIDARFVQGSGG